MSLGPQEIVAVTQDVWQTALGIELEPEPPEAAEPAAGPTLEGVVAITGDWLGAVVVQVPLALADRAARSMFVLGDAAASAEDMQDVIGEITNMTGGNLKGLLDGRCQLGLPTVVVGADYRLSIPSARLAARVSFRHGDDLAVVSVVSSTPAAA